jgi:hypothetical protein
MMGLSTSVGVFIPEVIAIDQMVQAARSGKQNLAEGSGMSGVSKENELKLTGVCFRQLAGVA